MDDDALDDLEPELQEQAFVISTNPTEVTALSRHAQKAFEVAEPMAAAAPDGVLTCEHLLLALAGDPESAAAQVLGPCGLDAATLETTIEFVRGRYPAAAPPGAVTRSPRVERVLAQAGREAANRQCDRIETLHLLIGILREGHGIAALALESPGVGHERLGAAISQATRNGVTDPS